MHPKLAGLVLFLAFVSLAPIDAQGAKLPALAVITSEESVDGITFIFDPGKVSAVYVMPLATLRRGIRGTLQVHHGSPTTHVWGIAASPVPIKATPEEFLQKNNIDSKFVQLKTLEDRKLYLRATAVTLIVSPTPPPSHDPKVKSFIFPGPGPGPGARASATPNPWQVFQTPDEVKELVNAKRVQQEASE